LLLREATGSAQRQDYGFGGGGWCLVMDDGGLCKPGQKLMAKIPNVNRKEFFCIFASPKFQK
jgi:hypothetical protein